MSLLKPLLIIVLAGCLAAGLAWIIATQVIPLPNQETSDASGQNSQPIKPPTATPQPITLNPDALYSLINAHRVENHLSPLLRNLSLEKSATLKVDDMNVNQYWRHQDKEQIESWYLFKQAGYNYQLAGENLGFAVQSEWQVFADWVASPTHNGQLLTREYEDMGLAIDCVTYTKLAGSGCLVVLHLAQPGL
ncbi:MAG: CAP domain-containing protein [Patescibacteria group bacterium]|nr:hypothetical protein [Patescibacteria group bacterium]